MSFPVTSGAGAAAAFSGSRGIGLSNTVHSELAACLPLPSLPVFCGASDQDLRLVDSPARLNRVDVLAQSGKIAELLRHTDVSYLNLRDEAKGVPYIYVEPLELHDEVLRCNPEAFEYSTAGPVKEQISGSAVPEKRQSESSFSVPSQTQNDYNATHNRQLDNFSTNDLSTLSSKKSKVKKKGGDGISIAPDSAELQGAHIQRFCEFLEDLCSKSELNSDDRDEAEWLSLPLSDLRLLVNEITSIREKKLLHLVPIEVLVRLLKVLDHHIHRAEGLSIEECDNSSDSELVSSVFIALESIHAALAVMAHTDMPKQLYKEEIIERILEFSRRQIMDVMCACDPSYRALHRPSENTAFEDDYEENDAEFGSASKKRRTNKTLKFKKSASSRLSTAVNTILQKLCTVLGLLKDLLLIERLSDSCILQLVKTSITTFLVDNIQLLQLKAISLLSAIFYLYIQHRIYVIDEMVQLLWKLPYSKRALRSYHVREEEPRQIQMVTALLIQLIHCSANLPDALRKASNGNSILEASVDSSTPIKSHEAVTDACCLFWSRVLQRFASVKTQDASDLKSIIENLVTDLLTTLNLPEYPASAPILEVLCVLLLQNAGPKSKDVSARTMAIDILGTIAARLKRDALVCSQEKFWILQDFLSSDAHAEHQAKDICCVCLGARVENLFTCHGCQRLFHADCLGIKEHEISSRNWSCQTCICHKQLLVLQSCCNSQHKNNVKRNLKASKDSEVSKHDVVQQLLLNYLQDVTSPDDLHLFICWFYLCLWYKDDSNCQQKSIYYIARMKSKIIVRDSGTVSSMLTRDSIKKITLALGQNSSFCRGFDKILHTLLASLRENSPVIRAKALKAVSIIVEADPEVLGDKRVQSAVEGRFCDSAISVREAALELVGRHIASHPDVGFKYFEKIAERIKDTGVSVRKRAIKIIRDMCTSDANFSGFTRACTEIITRVSDDEASIQDLVCKTFSEFWFEEPHASQTQVFGDGSTVPLEIVKKTEQIVQMLRGMPNNQLLVTVIKRNLSLDFLPQSAKATGINPLSLATVRKRCELMCKCLLEKMLQVEEMNSDEVEVRALPYVLLLHAFCLVDPTLCAPASNPSQFVVTLQPYLKTQVDNRMVAQLLESILFIIDSVLPMLGKLPPIIVGELEQDLKQMIVRHSFLTVVHACIKCLCSASKMAGKGAAVVEQLVQFFFKCLDTQAVHNKQKVGRSLFCLGLLIRYGNRLLANSSNKLVDFGSSVRLFIKHLSAEDFVVKVRSLQALGFVLIARPEYMLESSVGKVLEETLSSAADTRLKIQGLQNMYEYLLDAESQMGIDKDDENVAGYTVGAGQSVPVAAGAGDTNICGGIVQLYWDNILTRCLDFNEQVRQSALKIVEVVLRQGLVHPITCVPYLIALETDPLESNSKLAHHLLMNMNEKYPAFFESRLGDGLQMSFMFMQSICGGSGNDTKVQSKMPISGKGKPEAGPLAQAKLGVSRIYKLIRGNRVSRNKFLSSIVRKFDNPRWSKLVIAFLTYCTEVLALLPFISPDEPLYLIYAINRVVQVRAGPLEANFKAWSSSISNHGTPYGNGMYQQAPEQSTVTTQVMSVDLNGSIQQNIDAHLNSNDLRSLDLNWSNHQQLDYSYRGSPETKLHAASYIDFYFSKDDLEKIQDDCLSAIALQLLLKLKRHLKIMYSLDDARCQAYSPTELPKPGEVISRQNIAFSIGECQFSFPTTPQELVQRYQEFKHALREDTVDYSHYTANIKRKRPTTTPRKVQARKALHVSSGNYNEEDDDEDYSGGSATRRISFSGSRRSSLRNSRQY